MDIIELWRVLEDEVFEHHDVSLKYKRTHFGKLIKGMCDEYGEKRVRMLFMFVPRNWDYIKSKLPKVYGVPNLGFIYGYRHTLFDLMKSKIAENKKRKDKRLRAKQRTKKDNRTNAYLYS